MKIVYHLLCHHPPDQLNLPASAFDISATVSKSVTLTIRQTLDGSITQRLGSLKLTAAPDHELDTLAWTSTAINRSKALETERDAALQTAKDSELRVQELAKQLEELIEVGRDSADKTLVVFADLLNTKKRKIRELHRLVETLRSNDRTGKTNSAGDDQKDGDVEGSETRQPGRRSGRSGKAKRKASEDVTMREPEPVEKLESDESGTFERINSPGAQRSDDSSARESDDEADIPPPPDRSSRGGVGIVGGSKTAGTGGSGQNPERDNAITAGDHSSKPASPPPQRRLPFSQAQKATSVVEDGAGDGDETSDDEL